VIADFGLAHEITSQLPYTKYATCCKADEIYKICSVIGIHMEFTQREGLEHASKIIYQFPESWSGLLTFDCTDLNSGLPLMRHFVLGIHPKGQQLWKPFSILSFRVNIISLHPFGLRLLLLGCLHLLD
nr:hypothetical protein [Tanacetum cinerariifolium]